MIELSPGSRIGAYVIEDLIGRGGMGVLYRASQPSLGRMVALKLIAPELVADDEFRDRFDREARLAASIDHPNVIPIFEAGEDDGRLFIAMRFVAGTDLRRALEEGPFEVERALEVIAGIAAALDAAHANGLIHRDVKPANVLLAGESDHVYLTDFGLVRSAQVSTLTHSGRWLGTLGYVAPEQIEGDRVDGRADVYSLGCVAFELLTGRVPFEGTEVRKLWQHVHAEPLGPGDIDPSLAAFDGPLRRAMAKRREDRPASAGELAREVTAAARGDRPTLVQVPRSFRGGRRGPASNRGQTQASDTDTTGPRTSRRRIALAALGALVLGAVGVGVATLIGGEDAESEPATFPTVRRVYPEGGFETRHPLSWGEQGAVVGDGFRAEFTSPDGETITVLRTAEAPPRLPAGRATEPSSAVEANTAAVEGTENLTEFTGGDCAGRCVALRFRVADGDGYLLWGPINEARYVEIAARELIDEPGTHILPPDE